MRNTEIQLPLLKVAGRNISEIIVHCTATRAGRPVSVSDIDRWHRRRGFTGIGYHYLVGLDGRVLAGRSVELPGAHCRGHNSRSIGVVYVGGLDSEGYTCDTRTAAQKASLEALLRRLVQLYPGAKIYGHRDFAAKDCPCFDATDEYAEICRG